MMETVQEWTYSTALLQRLEIVQHQEIGCGNLEMACMHAFLWDMSRVICHRNQTSCVRQDIPWPANLGRALLSPLLTSKRSLGLPTNWKR